MANDLTFEDPYTLENKKKRKKHKPHRFPSWLKVIIVIGIAVCIFRPIIADQIEQEMAAEQQDSIPVMVLPSLSDASTGPILMMETYNFDADRWLRHFTTTITISYEDGSTREIPYTYDGAIPPNRDAVLTLQQTSLTQEAVEIQDIVIDEDSFKWFEEGTRTNNVDSCTVDTVSLASTERAEKAGQYRVWISRTDCTKPDSQSHELTICYYKEAELIYVATTGTMETYDETGHENTYMGVITVPYDLDYDETVNLLTSWTAE